MRVAIEKAWVKENAAWDLYFDIRKRYIKKKPANMDFISRLARITELWIGCCDTYQQMNPKAEVTV